MLDHDNNADTEWWNSEKGQSAYIDFTKKEAADWYAARLTKLKNDAGIDSFKFDAGETSWLPKVVYKLNILHIQSDKLISYLISFSPRIRN